MLHSDWGPLYYTMTATDIRLNTRDNTLTVTFDSGDSVTIHAAYLRQHSPSAANRQALKPIESFQGIHITALTPVGHYALKITFSDGHASGLYTWDYLHTIGHAAS